MQQKDMKEIAGLQARKTALAIRMRAAKYEDRQRLFGEIVDIDIRISTIRHVLPEHR